jgi:hypothetical protein
MSVQKNLSGTPREIGMEEEFRIECRVSRSQTREFLFGMEACLGRSPGLLTDLIAKLNPATAIFGQIYGIASYALSNMNAWAEQINTVVGAADSIIKGDSTGLSKKVAEALDAGVPLALSFVAKMIPGGQGFIDSIRNGLSSIKNTISTAVLGFL